MASRAVGDGAGDMPVSFDLAWGDVVAFLEEADEPGEGVVLGGAGAFFVEVADEADTDGMFVPVVVIVRTRPTVGAFALLSPAETDFDSSVGGAVAVIDDEMVSDAVPATLFVPAVDFGEVSTFAGGVVDDDAPP